MYKLVLGVFGLFLMIAIVLFGVIAFSAPVKPPTMASMRTESRKSVPDFPAPLSFQARDGTNLRYYVYPAKPDKVAVLVHGSVFAGTSMHALAESLQAAGVTVFVPDIRGHGGSGTRGDIDYIGQIDDDLADFVAQLGPAGNGGTIRTLIGFSAGAGFAIRFAGGPYGALFDRYVFLAPILPGSPTLRPRSGGWINVSVPRLTMITWLNSVGIHWLDGLSVISYAVSPEIAQLVASTYSYRLFVNFRAGPVYESSLRNIHRPSAVLVGSADEQEFSDQFAPLFQRLGVVIPVTILPAMKHADMVRSPEALQAVVHAVSSQN